MALVVSPTLTAAAEWKARNMAAYDYLDHDDPAPDARTADERLVACGYPATEWGENIATGYATAQAVVDAWLASPEHRANIERPEYRATGVGAAGITDVLGAVLRRRGRRGQRGRRAGGAARGARDGRRALRRHRAGGGGASLGHGAPPARQLRAAPDAAWRAGCSASAAPWCASP